MQRDRWLQLVKDSSVFGSKIFLVSLRKNAIEHQLVGNRFVNSIKRAPGPSKKCLKNCQSCNGSSNFSLMEDQCFGKPFSEPMAFANFSDL